MPQRKDLDLLGPVTTPDQDQELEDTVPATHACSSTNQQVS
jgi:hypothetical protein